MGKGGQTIAKKKDTPYTPAELERAAASTGKTLLAVDGQVCVLSSFSRLGASWRRETHTHARTRTHVRARAIAGRARAARARNPETHYCLETH